MTESILLRIRRDNVRTLAEAVQSWTGEHPNRTSALDVQDALRVCVRWPSDFQELWESLWRTGLMEFADYQRTGELLLDLVDQAIVVLQRLRVLVSPPEAANPVALA